MFFRRSTAAPQRRRARLSAGLVVGLLAGGLSGGAVLAPATPAQAAQNPTSCSSSVALTNGGFELPTLPANSYAFLPESQVPGWLTTATDDQVELWRAPFSGVPAGSGSQFAELNASQASTLYQDVATTPGQTLRWELLHRGREGVDVMAVHIAAPATRQGTATRQGPLISDGNTAWGKHSGVYTVPAGQTLTRFAFQAVASTGPNASFGNFLDGISFGTQPCLVTTTSAGTPGGTPTADVGDTLTYTVATVNAGGNPAREAVVVDALPAGVDFLPGTIRVVTGSTTAARTDAAGDDGGEYDATTRTVRVRVGTGATSSAGGSIDAGDARSISYQVRVAPSASGLTVRNDATVTYRDDLTGASATSTSDEAATPVRLAADLGVTALDQSPAVLVAGRSAGWTATLANAGPSPESAAVLTASIPAGLAGVTATTTGGTCTVAAPTVTCRYSALASGASRVVTIAGTVPADTAPGTRYGVVATVSGDAHDRRPADNSLSTTDAVTALADVSVGLVLDGASGGTVTYRATVTNDGPSTARGVRLVDPLPAGAVLVSATVPGGSCSPAGSTGTVGCALPDLPPGSSRDVLLTVQLDPGGDGDQDNVVSVGATTPDSDADDLTAAVQGTATVVADLSLELSLSATTFRPGDSPSFTLVLRNEGDFDATNVVVRPSLPPGVIIRGTDHGTCVPGNCTIPVLHAGEVLTIVGTAEVDVDAEEGTALASATVVSSVADEDQGDQFDSVVAEIVLEADLHTSATLANPDGPGALVAGGWVAGVTTVTNAGPTRAESLVVPFAALAGQPVPTVVLDGGGSCEYQGVVESGRAVDGGVVVCTLDRLGAGGTWTLRSRGGLPADYTGTTFSRTRAVTAASPDPDPSDDSATAGIAVVRSADVRVGKVGTASVVQTGPVEFQVTVTNAGPSDARGVLVREEPQPGVVITSAVPDTGEYSDATGAWRIPALPVGASTVLRVTGTAESADDVVNRAVFLASDTPHPDPAGAKGEATVDVLPAARTLSIQPRATVTPAAHQAAARVDDAVDLGYVVRNDGNVRMSGIRVAETLVAGGVTCPRDALAPGEEMTCAANGTHRVTQADFDDDQPLTSSATVTARAPDSTTDLTFGPAGATVAMAPGTSALATSLLAQWDDADGDDALDVDETVVWTAVVTNTGDLGVGGLSAGGDTPGLVCAAAVLAPGATTTCVSGPYRLTAGDVAAGQRAATVTATAVPDRTGTPVDSPPATAAVPAAPAPALGLSLTGVVAPAAHQDAARRGDTVTWRHVVTNLGNVQVTGLAVDGPGGVPVTCAATVLDPGSATTCTADTPSVVGEGDVLAGRLVGRASVTGRPAAGGTQVRSAQAQGVVGVAGAVRVLTLTAHAATPGGGGVRPGDSISYTYDVRNDGDLTMRLVAVSDELVGPAQCAQETLAPGQTTTCVGGGSYRVGQADFDAGRPISGLAWVSGIPNGSAASISFGPASAPVALAAAAPALLVTAVADWLDDGDDALDEGESIDWSALVANTGDVTLTGVSVSAPAGIGPVTCPVAALGPGDRMRCTAPRYTVSAADADLGELTVRFDATGVDPRGGPAADDDDVTTSSVPDPEVGLTIAPAVVGSVPPSVGDRVRWRFTVTNHGNVPLEAIAVVSDDGDPVTCPAVRIRPGESTTCSAATVHTVTEDDVRAGALTAAGTAEGRPTAGAVPPVHSAPAAATLRTTALVHGLGITGTATPSGGSPAAAGDRVSYRWDVRNTGNVTMGGLAVTDSAGGTATCAAGSLAPGASTTCSGGETHRVSQADFDAGLPVGLSATVSGVPAGASDPLTAGPAADPVPVTAARPGLSATQRADWADDGDEVLEAGEEIVWTVVVTNTGDVTVSDLWITDPLGYVGCPQTSVAPQDDVTCVSDPYRVTEDDAVARERTNTASAAGVEPRARAQVVSNVATAAAVGAAPPSPELTLAVDGLVSPAARQAAAELGDTVRWRYEVTNSGGVPVAGLSVADVHDGTVACPAGTLAPGQSLVCAGSQEHPVAEADLLARALGTGATAVGTADGGASVGSAPAAGTVATARARAALRLSLAFENETAGARAAAPLVGDLVRVRYRLTNAGTVTLHRVGVTDESFGPVTCAPTVLAPGESGVCRTDGPRRVAAADSAAGWLTSWARASGSPAAASGLPAVSTAVVERVPLRSGAPGDPGAVSPVAGPGTPGAVPDVPAAAAGPVTRLARTGTEVGAQVGWGVLLLVAGAGLVGLSCRRGSLRSPRR